MVEGVEGIEFDPGNTNVAPIPAREARPEPFTQTKSEWAADNRELVYREQGVSADSLIYSVPTGKTLYITAAWITLSARALNNGTTASLDIELFRDATAATSQNIFISASTEAGDTRTAASHANISSDYYMPIKIREFVRADYNATGVFNILDARVGFVGYLE